VEFFTSNASVIVSMVLAAMLGLSVYFPLMAGQLSLASPGFYALGGYTAAVLSTKVFPHTSKHIDLPFILLEMLIAGVLSGLLALIVGIPALRLRGIYLALATIAFVEIFRVISLNVPLFGGAIGLFGIPQPFEAANPLPYLLIGVPMLALAMAFVYRLERSRTGRAFTAIREDELAADAMGIAPTYYKVLAFTMGGILAGMVGALNAHVLNTWNARQGTFDASIAFLAFVLIGGSRTYLGPVLGGLVLTVLPELLRNLAGVQGEPLWLVQFLKDGRLIIYGVLIVLGTIFFPQGIVTPAIAERFRRKRPAPVVDLPEAAALQ